MAVCFVEDGISTCVETLNDTTTREENDTESEVEEKKNSNALKVLSDIWEEDENAVTGQEEESAVEDEEKKNAEEAGEKENREMMRDISKLEDDLEARNYEGLQLEKKLEELGTEMQSMKEELSLLKDQMNCEHQDDLKKWEEMMDTKIEERVQKLMAMEKEENSKEQCSLRDLLIDHLVNLLIAIGQNPGDDPGSLTDG